MASDPALPPPVEPADTLSQADRVLIVDDSVVARTVMARSIDGSDRLVVAGSVATSEAALEFLARRQVEIVVLDIAMPGTDGLTALPDLIAAARGAKILVVSSSAGEGAAASIQALSLGAADTLAKPSADALASRFAQALIDKLHALSGAQPAQRAASAAIVPTIPSVLPLPTILSVLPLPTIPSVLPLPPQPVADGGPSAYDIVAIGASTGGIHALSHVLRALPPGFRLPIVVTQHLPASFMIYYAAQLALLGGRPCDVATDRMRIRPGRIVVAPGDAHIEFVSLGEGGSAIRLTREAVASGCMPSVDPMLASLAGIYGSRMLAIVLSGMGRDGVIGARRVYEAGGAVVVQDRESSVVWGMPGAVAAAGCAHAVLPPAAIGTLVAARQRPA